MYLIPLFFLLLSCSKDQTKIDNELTGRSLEIKGAELPFLPEIRQSGIVLKNRNCETEDMLTILKNEGFNTLRWNLIIL